MDTPTLDPNDPQFAPVRADLARLFIEHKAELGLAAWSDEAIVSEVNLIASSLIAAGIHAADRGDAGWLERHRWFGEAFERQFKGELAVPLNG
jgi:hypothetical protein